MKLAMLELFFGSIRALVVYTATIVGSSFALAQSSSTGPPEALVRALEMRKGWDHAVIEWRIDFNDGYPSSGAKSWYMTSKYANGDQLCITHGDESGCRQPANAGQYWACSEERMLIKENREWLYLEDTTTVTDVGDWEGDGGRRFGYSDVRTLGFFPYDAPMPLDSCLSFRGPTAYYEEAIDDNLYVVTRHFPSTPGGPELLMQWWIDPGKGWSPTRVTMTDSNGQVILESTCALEKFGDTWFPSHGILRQNGEDYCNVVVEHAVFNSPELAPDVGFKDLSLIPGIQVAGRDDVYGAFWDGERLVDRPTWADRLRDGTVDMTAYKAIVARNNTELGHGRYPKRDKDGFWIVLHPPTREPGLWEDYVRRFIQVAGLNEVQAPRAWDALRKHQKTALKWLNDHDDQIKKADADIARAKAALAAVAAGHEPTQASQSAVAKPPVGDANLPGGAAEPSAPAAEKNAGKPTKSSMGTAQNQGESSAKPSSASNPGALRKELADLEERRARLLDPIDDIFKTKLQPDLFALLTPEQKESLAKRQADVAVLKDAAKKESPASSRTP